ncbi:MAG: nucleotidyl transferase AbiEii/AbiGii toxin family protein [Kiritimatiellia bacterium]
MNALEMLLRRMANLFQERRQPWALVGGLAVSVRTEPRFTRDLDLAVAVANDHAAEALVHDLHGVGFHTLATVEQEATHRLATARLAPSGSHPQGLILDLLFASSGIETEICQAAENLTVFPELSVPVARLYHLITLKVLARDDRTRPQDAADLRQLIAVAEPSDLVSACTAGHLIETRGFHRSRNLVQAVQEAFHEFRRDA